jgi:hypothetical protein
MRYDDYCADPPTPCILPVVVEKDMTAPIYFYYELSNFYQNHRRYVKSRRHTQRSTAQHRCRTRADAAPRGAQ